MDPLVSVILRAHPGYIRFIPRAFRSIVNQSILAHGAEIEVVLAFDGPDTPELAPVFEEMDRAAHEIDQLHASVLVFPEPTGFWAIPTNRAIVYASAPWIAFLDADNEFDRYHLENLLHAVRGTSNRPAFAYSRRVYVVDEGFEGEPPALGESPLVPWCPDTIQRLFLGPTHNFIDSSDLLIGKGVCYWVGERTGAIFKEDLRRYGDWEFVTRLAKLSLPGAAVDAATNIYHWHGKNLQLTRKPEIVSLPTPGGTILASFEEARELALDGHAPVEDGQFPLDPTPGEPDPSEEEE